MAGIDRDRIEKVIVDYDALIERALTAVAPGCGYYAAVEPEDLHRLRLDGDTAWLEWREAENDWDGVPCASTRSASFPAALLLMSSEDFVAFQTQTKKELAEREAAKQTAYLERQRETKERNERALLAELKAKYEPVNLLHGETQP